MRKRYYFVSFISVIISVSSFFIHPTDFKTWAMGFLMGINITMIILVTIGRWQAKKAALVIDNSIKEIIIQNFKNTDND